LAGDYPKSKQGVEDKDREIVARLVTDDDVELNELQLLDLPLGVLEMIMKFCIGLEYLNFRATCKSCHLAAPVLQWRVQDFILGMVGYCFTVGTDDWCSITPSQMLSVIFPRVGKIPGVWLVWNMMMMIIDIIFIFQHYCSWEQDAVKPPRSSCRFPVEYFLTKCDQHLLLVFVDHFGESVEVFKLNDLKNEWEKTNGIGRHMIYISDNACLCKNAEISEMENKIFFARLYNKNGKVVFYSLETGMYHTFNARNIEESFEDFVGTKHYPFSPRAWIEPSWS
nr:hypothetical protein [Tanacetum cinerariifolium]